MTKALLASCALADALALASAANACRSLLPKRGYDEMRLQIFRSCMAAAEKGR
jgi:hypothetical protein